MEAGEDWWVYSEDGKMDIVDEHKNMDIVDEHKNFESTLSPSFLPPLPRAAELLQLLDSVRRLLLLERLDLPQPLSTLRAASV
jgi:hypothetical protein